MGSAIQRAYQSIIEKLLIGIRILFLPANVQVFAGNNETTEMDMMSNVQVIFNKIKDTKWN